MKGFELFLSGARFTSFLTLFVISIKVLFWLSRASSKICNALILFLTFYGLYKSLNFPNCDPFYAFLCMSTISRGKSEVRASDWSYILMDKRLIFSFFMDIFGVSGTLESSYALIEAANWSRALRWRFTGLSSISSDSLLIFDSYYLCFIGLWRHESPSDEFSSGSSTSDCWL